VPVDADRIRAGVTDVADRIRAAAQHCDRDPATVGVVAATKTRTVDELAVLAEVAGASGLALRAFGENRMQEAVVKIDAWRALGVPYAVPWHFIGRLQVNKVPQLHDRFSLLHACDRSELVAPLARRAPDVPVLVQVNTTGEASKAGVAPNAAGALVDAATSAGVAVRGFMTMAPFGEPAAAREAFDRLARLRDDVATAGHDLPELSMGMSDDFEIAIGCGATLIRVGRALFGERGG
jgi:pyridoxal phosphate enzyme (YggS family)